MYFLLSIGIELLSAAVSLLPVFLVLHFVCFRRMRQTALCLMLALYLACLYFVTGLPTVLFVRFDPSFYLIPFVGIADDIRNSLLNILLFLPLGFLIPVFRENFRSLKAVLLLGFTCSLFLELAQIFTYRLSDINDLITNTTGAALGYLAAWPLFKRMPHTLRLSGRDLCLTAAVTVLDMFFLQPLLTDLIWGWIP